jgi:hypothetical protein
MSLNHLNDIRETVPKLSLKTAGIRIKINDPTNKTVGKPPEIFKNIYKDCTPKRTL